MNKADADIGGSTQAGGDMSHLKALGERALAVHPGLRGVWEHYAQNLGEMMAHVQVLWSLIDSVPDGSIPRQPVLGRGALGFGHSVPKSMTPDLRAELRNWLICGAIGDAMEELWPFHLCCWKILMSHQHREELLAANGLPVDPKLRTSLSDEQIVKHFKGKYEKFERSGVSGQIAEIRSLLREPLPFSDAVESINRLRACLRHRNGFVGELDLKSGEDRLSVIYATTRLVTEYPEGVQRLGGADPTWPPEKFKQSILQGFRVHKSYGRGERIILDFSDFNDVLHTLHSYVHLTLAAVSRVIVQTGLVGRVELRKPAQRVF